MAECALTCRTSPFIMRMACGDSCITCIRSAIKSDKGRNCNRSRYQTSRCCVSVADLSRRSLAIVLMLHLVLCLKINWGRVAESMTIPSNCEASVNSFQPESEFAAVPFPKKPIQPILSSFINPLRKIFLRFPAGLSGPSFLWVTEIKLPHEAVIRPQPHNVLHLLCIGDATR